MACGGTFIILCVFGSLVLPGLATWIWGSFVMVVPFCMPDCFDGPNQDQASGTVVATSVTNAVPQFAQATVVQGTVVPVAATTSNPISSQAPSGSCTPVAVAQAAPVPQTLSTSVAQPAAHAGIVGPQQAPPHSTMTGFVTDDVAHIPAASSPAANANVVAVVAMPTTQL